MIAADEALGYLVFIAGWGGGRFPVYLDGAGQPALGVHKADRLRALVSARGDQQIEVGLPAVYPTVLWCWLESRDQVRRAKGFRPLPSLVLQMGQSCRRLCLWAINEQMPWLEAEAANKRLAYAMRAPQKYAGADSLRIPLPGTFLRVGRKRPAEVVVTRMDVDSFNRTQVVATLRDPPPSWAQRQRESGAWR